MKIERKYFCEYCPHLGYHDGGGDVCLYPNWEDSKNRYHETHRTLTCSKVDHINECNDLNQIWNRHLETLIFSNEKRLTKTQLHYRDNYGYSYLHYLVRQEQNRDINRAVEYCLSEGLSDSPDPGGNTALMYSAKNHVMTDIIELISRSSKAEHKINYQSPSGYNALHFSAEYNSNPAIALKLIENGSDIENQRYSDGWTPIYDASLNNPNPQVIATLLDHGALVHPSHLELSVLEMIERFSKIMPIKNRIEKETVLKSTI
jgi:hypothetical protein